MMNVKKTLLAVSAGVVLGFMIKHQLDERPIKAEIALKKAKERFKENGEVSGSWIYMKPEEIELHGLLYIVYRGGITRTTGQKNTQYEFFVDAKTGTIIDTSESDVII